MHVLTLYVLEVKRIYQDNLTSAELSGYSYWAALRRIRVESEDEDAATEEEFSLKENQTRANTPNRNPVNKKMKMILTAAKWKFKTKRWLLSNKKPKIIEITPGWLCTSQVNPRHKMKVYYKLQLHRQIKEKPQNRIINQMPNLKTGEKMAKPIAVIVHLCRQWIPARKACSISTHQNPPIPETTNQKRSTKII